MWSSLFVYSLFLFQWFGGIGLRNIIHGLSVNPWFAIFSVLSIVLSLISVDTKKKAAAYVFLKPNTQRSDFKVYLIAMLLSYVSIFIQAGIFTEYIAIPENTVFEYLPQCFYAVYYAIQYGEMPTHYIIKLIYYIVVFVCFSISRYIMWWSGVNDKYVSLREYTKSIGTYREVSTQCYKELCTDTDISDTTCSSDTQ